MGDRPTGAFPLPPKRPGGRAVSGRVAVFLVQLQIDLEPSGFDAAAGRRF